MPTKPWVQTIHRETGLVEHICEHGVGHPAAASVHWLKIHGFDGYEVHGCDGCCQSAEWRIADATEGYERANFLLMACTNARKERPHGT